ncbi:hypothetical protein ACFVXR_17325 [Bacillus thuringiensis]|uniref:hypothetical protein n=1 Tax=Bacillus TaxID=1386 RepID=UPI000BEC2971|nr:MULTISPECIES: hypothetical protein [Bacillus]KAA1808117.1 hypothetical protein FXB61_000983 [Bacillus cereus]KAB7681045.1 hypothetical protein GBN91_14145 [Bacillus sp. B1-WWTP-T-0.5-Post-4]MCC2539174.1 hypothetical protein [Bacillus thuringiensis]MCU4771660.1 hypothetical protein [Bacillus cereus]MCU4778050.1 hypothetical protein [Bacillus cereus]
MDENQMMPLQAGESFPFMGRLVDAERTETGIFVQIPADMLNNAGLLNGVSRVEVWREMDGTVKFRIATLCEICKRGARLYPLDMGFAKKNICLECYASLTGNYPSQEPPTPTNENNTQTEQEQP